MVKNVLLGFATAALAVASAATSYSVTFYQPVTVNGAQLKAGEYKVELKSDCRVVGDIKAPRILIADGASFKGNVDMDVKER